MDRVLNLYTFKPKHVINNNNKEEENAEIMVQGVIEAIDSKDNHACFVELKKEQSLIMRKQNHDFANHCTGHFFRNHVLLDVLVLYKKYVQEFGNTSAFGKECVNACLDIVCCMYELFSFIADINVYVRADTDPDDDLFILLTYLQSSEYITIHRI
ncbi:hypothetical protein SlGVgp082 [Spodoptera litura granulovirus]|uniref:P18 n=1 Tax=Spodoptera litura granulovirus TaxID=359919 RepID=A5IZT4_9BBAC|nr:hypothetical protein SlGVgp082 [Spodoptera litura granulovirus]ABQ52025.1 hypothetical protein SlGVgp082 [Spodoptera litura granulovirus]